MGRGGARPGAGRKPKPTHLRAIDGGAGRRGSQSLDTPDTAIAEPAQLEPPADLSPAELAVWNELATDAIAKGTLTPATLVSFVHLCQAESDRRELRARITPQRSSAGELLPLLYLAKEEEMATRREIRQLQKDIKAAMKDFMLAPFGKEILSPGAAQAADPLDDFMRKRG